MCMSDSFVRCGRGLPLRSNEVCRGEVVLIGAMGFRSVDITCGVDVGCVDMCGESSVCRYHLRRACRVCKYIVAFAVAQAVALASALAVRTVAVAVAHWLLHWLFVLFVALALALLALAVPTVALARASGCCTGCCIGCCTGCRIGCGLDSCKEDQLSTRYTRHKDMH